MQSLLRKEEFLLLEMMEQLQEKEEYSYQPVTDKGSEYTYMVEATGQNDGEKYVSDPVTTIITSGLKGYSIVVDTNPTTTPDTTIETTDTQYSITKVFNEDFYIHVGAVDNQGNMSVAHYQVDITPPKQPLVTATPIHPTKGNVTITIDYPSDSVVKEYRINGGAWMTYTSSIVMTDNGKVEARAIDKAGNISTIASYNVTNIDKNEPAIPQVQIYPDKIKVIAGADAEGETSVFYRINQQEWKEYENEIVLPDGIYDLEVKTVDLVGNESQVVRMKTVLYGQQLEKAKQLVANAVSLKTQSSIDEALAEVNALPKNASEKNSMLEQLEQIQIEVAEQLVMESSKNPTLENIEKAKYSVERVKDESLKTQWQNQLKVMENLLNDSYDIPDGTMMSKEAYLALKAIERAEKYTVSAMVKYAYKKFNEVPENDFYKEILRKRLQQLQNKYDDILNHQQQSYKLRRAILQVKVLENGYSPTLLRLAQEAVSALPDGDDKDILQARIDNVVSAVQNSANAKKVKEAEDAVANAEKYKTDYYINRATELVSQLPDGQDKQALQQRLDALKQTPLEDEIAYQKALDAVKLANKYKISYYYKKAMEAINLVKDENKKQELLQLLQSSNS